MKNTKTITVGSFPYSPSFNPYQKLITGAIEGAGANVVRIAPEKWFPVHKAIATNCDVLHFDWPHDWYRGRNFLIQKLKSQIYLAGLRKSRNQKLVWTAHNLVAHDAPNPAFEHRMIQSLIDQCDGIMVMSQDADAMLRDTYNVNPHTSVKKVYHGHYADCYPNQCSRADARQRLEIESDETLLVSIGTVKPYKGLEGLIEKIAKLPKTNFKWIIAGRASSQSFGEKIESLCRHAAKRGHQIEFQNKLVEDDELQHYFSAADACVLPFDKVLNSGSLLLAMSFGCPVIAPSIGSIPEVISKQWGFLYEPGNQDSLIETISTATKLIAKHDPETVRKQVIEFVHQQYNWEQAGQQLVNWYGELLT